MPGEGIDLQVEQALGPGPDPRRGDLDKFRKLWVEMGWDPNMVTDELIESLRSPQGALTDEAGPVEVTAEADSSAVLEGVVQRLLSGAK
jgi:hypothetical protein